MTGTCTHGPSAVTQERCGDPAVHTFTGPSGETFRECAVHSTAAIVTRPGDSAYAIGDTVTVRRYGRDYTAEVTRVSRTGRAYATFAYGNGATRTVPVV